MTDTTATPTEPSDDSRVGSTPSTLDFPVVGIGASAGGLEALLKFFENLPPDSGMAFVVVLHLSPKHSSNVPTLLSNVTPLPVQHVSGPVGIERNHVYVIPPGKLLAMDDNALDITDADRPRGRHVAIDLFFRSLAQVHGPRAVGIVLSGSGADGSAGIARVKEQGGLTFAQVPDEADFDSMPRSAIATSAIDFVLPVAQMPRKLIDLSTAARNIHLPPIAEPDKGLPPKPGRAPTGHEADEVLRDILVTLRARTGHDFRHYKRATMMRRLQRRLQVNGLSDLPSYRTHLHANADEAPALLKDLLIGVTNFFRDSESFDVLARDVLPQLFKGRSPQEQVRAWVAGCARGEEAYSLAMLLCEQAARIAEPPDMLVFATDIDERAITTARAGLYPESILTDVSPLRLRQFFTKEDTQYRIRKEVREKLLFAQHNLLRDPPFSQIDLISCRNLMIYIDRDVHNEMLEIFHFALKPGGFLFLGSSESADTASQLFTPVDKKHRIYRANNLSRGRRMLPALPLRLGAAGTPTVELPLLRSKASFADAHQRLLQQHAPPSVLINAESEIVHLSDNTGAFLRLAPGAPSHNLLSLVLPELRLELRAALLQARQSGRSVEARRVKVQRGGRPRYVSMVVRPVRDNVSNAEFTLVMFDEVDDTLGGEHPGDELDPAMTHLEGELQRTKDELKASIEQGETSSEELRASNEELQAINEELRSTTEELETSKEELQSINEELVTVNQELKIKVEETGKINDDLQNLIASTDIATVFVDRGMSIKRYTPRATDIFNLIPSDVGRSLLDITHRLDYPQLAADTSAAFQSLQIIEREVHSSDDRWYIARLLPYRTLEDHIGGAVLTFIEITRRRRAEQQLHEEQDRMRLVAASTRDYAIFTTDAEGRVTTWNQGAQSIFGYTEAEMLGQSSALLYLPEDRAIGALDDEMRRAREEGRAEGDRWMLRKEGSRFFCSGILTALEGGQGFAKIARDLTGLKQAETEREAQLKREAAAAAQARAVSEMKDEFLAVLSHELKNPLNLILVNAELLTRLPESRGIAPVARAAEVIRRTVVSQAQIIDDLLDMSRVQTGKLALNLGEVNGSAALQSIVAAASADAAARHLHLTLQPPAERVAVHADPVRLEQIMWNLLTNAIKFTPAGGSITVSLQQEDGMARLDVADTGRGIEPDFLPKVFDMFRQAESRSTHYEGGLGIGLALVKQLALLQGGRVEAFSEGSGLGARFTVWLPLHDGATAGPAAKAASPASTIAGLRVLIVDDAEETIGALGELLKLEGAHVSGATSVPQALQMIGKQSFDLIVSDIAMPGMNGYELLLQLRGRPDAANTPTIALSGLGRPADAKRALDAGFDAHLGKPVTLEALTEAMRLAREHRSARAGE
ncbi:MAG TPA: CheR family methyltransferase [Burkholderiaceae bacterium]|nr:CheR family methyltransferase [Burkholderiaceae bacterium]